MIKGIDHIGIAVKSIAEARVFYESLGLEVTTIEEVEQEMVRVAMIPCGDTKIELLEPTSVESPVARFLDQRGPGIHHLCLRSSDIHEDDEKLRTQNYRVLKEEPSRGAGGTWVQFVHPKDANGVLVELAQKKS